MIVCFNQCLKDFAYEKGVLSECLIVAFRQTPFIIRAGVSVGHRPYWENSPEHPLVCLAALSGRGVTGGFYSGDEL
jgi:hypothetical protein